MTEIAIRPVADQEMLDLLYRGLPHTNPKRARKNLQDGWGSRSQHPSHGPA